MQLALGRHFSKEVKSFGHCRYVLNTSDCLQVQKGAMVAAGSLVAPNTTVPTGEIWAGNPAKKLRALDPEEADFILQSAVNYSALARIHAAENAKTPEEIQVRAAVTLQACLTVIMLFIHHQLHRSRLSVFLSF